MQLTRRKLLGGLLALPLVPHWAISASRQKSQAPLPQDLPTRSYAGMTFVNPPGTHLDAATKHPVSLGALQAVQDYYASRALDPEYQGYQLPAQGPIKKFARLVNAGTDEVTYVQSTTTGEQMVLRALGIPEAGGHIITDTLHFFGSLPIYSELRKQGMEVTFVRDRKGRIDIRDIEQAIRSDTRLISLSLVSTINGFSHDLKAVTRLAHRHGIRVYADIIHAAGCIPLDLKSTGVDFAACASYKWLMGDFGLGFLYASKDALSEVVRRNWGYYGLTGFTSHALPYDEPGDDVVDHAYGSDASGHFALGTRQHSVIAHLDHSLGGILDAGVEKIHAHSSALTEHLRRELVSMGFDVYTPEDSPAPMITCTLKNARERLGPGLARENIALTLSPHRFRASVSVYNTEQDIERLARFLHTYKSGKSAA